MKNTNYRRLYYHVRHKYITTNNLVVLIGLLVAASWAWGSVQAMERNYALQKEVDYKQRQLQLSKLQTEKLQYEQNYYKSDEYKELAAREKVGLVSPGEKVLILPPNTVPANDVATTAITPHAVAESNFQQWINFLFGGASRSLRG
jgi:cell division protein FtsB